MTESFGLVHLLTIPSFFSLIKYSKGGKETWQSIKILHVTKKTFI